MPYTKVTLVAVTQPRVDGINTAEEFVAYAARVSNPANQLNTMTAPKLISYLIRNQHWSPLEMVSITMEIRTTRDIGRQVLRHRSFSFQEFSGRYAEAFGFTKREARLQDDKNRQNSLETDDSELHTIWDAYQGMVLKEATKAYNWALTNGIAKEQARAVLPEGMNLTTMYMAGTLRSWLHFCLLRADNGTQKEHREIAEQALIILQEEFPSISEIVHDTFPQNSSTIYEPAGDGNTTSA